MTRNKRIIGGEKNEKTGIDWSRTELEEVCDLYIELDGKNIHESNTKIQELALKIGRTVRSVENQLLGFKKVATKNTGRKNYNRLIPLIWKKKTEKPKKESKQLGFQFRVSSALKDIIGQDLITDDYIAVFELVKNSYDAYASRVDIYFENIYSENSKIIIKDNGKGMDSEDLKNKWLFVAYSAKREGTEDNSFDYRDNIYKKRAFAGAKGIGRFSCDRLGRILYLETTKKIANAKTEVLVTDWGKFEQDSTQEFINIGIEHFQIPKSNFELSNGTVLEIHELRSNWDKKKLLKLKSSLTKLINPNRGRGEQQFKIYIHVEDEKQNDKELDEKDKINGEVRNFIFEELGLKTTKIYSSISNDGKYITTELLDGGTLIYRIKEQNKYDLLDNIEFTIYYLNQAAKITFKTRMGISSKDYGHIFLYKNGFRIYPYGEPGEDPLKIDARKAQGTRRFLGTRELIGQIEIFSDTDQLRETSSRGDGLIRTETYSQLEDCFWEVLKRFEKYVVEVQKWGLSIEDNEDEKLKERISNLIRKLTNSNTIVEFEYPENFIEILSASQAQSSDAIIKNLKRLAIESNNNKLLKSVLDTSKKLIELRKINKEIEAERDEVEKSKREIEKQLKITEKQVELLKDATNEDTVELMSIEHHVNQGTFRITENLQDLYETTKKDSPSKEIIINVIDNISLENQKIASLVKFVSKANFDLLSSEITGDLAKYIEQYIEKVYKKDRIKIINKTILKKVKVIYDKEISFIREFIPLELNIVLDNLLDNSFKATASEVDILLKVARNSLIIDYRDNGIGINALNKEKIFEFGYTSTKNGTGIGLHHSKRIIAGMSGKIYLLDSNEGANFIIEIPKK